MDQSGAKGTLAFVFTDIEGSTRMWESHPEAASAAIWQHDQLLSRALQGGDIFKTAGDAFCVAFPTVADALEACVTAARAVNSEPWPDALPIRVRFALHAGAAQIRDGDYFGSTLNRTARILSTIHGGQIVLSEVAYGLCRDTLPDGVEVLSLGDHRLKDLARSEQLYQVCHADLPREFPPLRSLESYRTNLPVQLTPFVGRQDEIEELQDLLQNARLVTLLGSGGCGKTRLAYQTAADLLDKFPDGVWTIELASTTDDDGVPRVAATTLGLREAATRDASDATVFQLKDKRALLILDNCEQVLNGAASLADRVVRECPGVQILATSREALGIYGERRLRIRSLTLPEQSEHNAESVSHYEAVQLFVDRAISARPGFMVTNANAPALAEVCLRLDGIPLAIELAAARLSSMSLEDLLARMSDMSRLLVGGSRLAPQRHQTLRAMIDWSHSLLAPKEQILFRRLSAFADGCSLATAEDVVAFGEIDRFEVLDLMSGLVEKSLVVFDDSESTPRYRLLESIRQYSNERLASSGEGEEVRNRHMDVFFRLSKTPLAGQATEREAYRVMKRELPNVLAALEAAFSSLGDLDHAAEALYFLGPFFEGSAMYRQPLAFAERGIALAQAAQAEVPVELLVERCRYMLRLGRFRESLELTEQAVEVAQRAGKPNPHAMALYWRSMALVTLRDYDLVEQLLLQSLQIAEEHGLHMVQASVLQGLGLSCQDLGQYDRAAEWQERAVKLIRAQGRVMRLPQALNNLGIAYRDSHQFDRARETLLEGLEICGKELISSRAYLCANLGSVEYLVGNYGAATPYTREALRLARESEDAYLMCECVGDLGGVAIRLGHLELAATLIAASRKRANETGMILDSEEEPKYYVPQVTELRASLGDEEYGRIRSRAIDDGWELAVDLALSSEVFA